LCVTHYRADLAARKANGDAGAPRPVVTMPRAPRARVATSSSSTSATDAAVVALQAQVTALTEAVVALTQSLSRKPKEN
jgi:hypothetical protein